VTVKEISPPVYPLRDGLKPGDVVKLLESDRGWWQAQRESDGLRTLIYLVNINQNLSRWKKTPRGEAKRGMGERKNRRAPKLGGFRPRRSRLQTSDSPTGDEARCAVSPAETFAQVAQNHGWKKAR